MGVINVTPDSFSGDGLYGDPSEALRLAEEHAAAGADVLDIGGESTRPGYVPVPLDQELRRVIPAIEAVTSRVPLPVSVDTTKAEVARRAVQAGATIVNDVSGLHDPAMAGVARDAGAWLVLVHSAPTSDVPDVVTAVADGLGRLTTQAEAQGVPSGSVLVDPGLGMGKGWRDNLRLLARLGELRTRGYPVLIGPSRKATISRVLGVGPDDRLEGSEALVAAGIAQGADVVRVHDVRQMTRVARMMDALARGTPAADATP
jgi:dihydropteroate synthase